MSGNEWWSTKLGTKLLSDLVIFLVLSSEIPQDFHEWIVVVTCKYLMWFLAGIDTKQLWNIPEERYFAILRTLNLFIKSFANYFVDFALNFSGGLFNSFSISACFIWSNNFM